MMKKCELCEGRAQIHCVADQAILCWSCDAKVHSANFLVARHTRRLLCRVCQGPTPWSATGARLGLTASACKPCVDRKRRACQEAVVPRSPPQPPESVSCVEEAASGEEAVVLGKRVRACNDEDEGSSSSSSPNNFAPPATAEVSSSCGRNTRLSQKIPRAEPGRVDSCGSMDLGSMRRFHRDESGSGRADFYTFM